MTPPARLPAGPVRLAPRDLPDLVAHAMDLAAELQETLQILRSALPDLPAASNGRSRPAPAGADDAGDPMDHDFQPTTATALAPVDGNAQQEAEASPEDLLNMKEVATRLRIHVRTLRTWRHVGDAPPEFVVGSRPKWRRGDVESWLAERSAR